MGKQKRKPKKPISTRYIAIIIGLTACLNIIIALGALTLGLWLDDLLEWRGIATVTLMIISFPISLYFMVRLALMLIHRFGAATHSQVADTPQDKEE
ncbi:MAG: hypothetical protein WBC91_22455 [Phototrophicaceae bacterium]